MTRRVRGSINQKAVVDAALAVADREGLEGVTIRAVAAELGASAMALYTHVASKEVLFDEMFAEVIERLVQIEEQPTWQAELEVGCRHARAVLLAHPRWVPLLSRVAVPPMTMKLYDRLLTLMAADGFAPEAAMLTVSAAISFTIGVVLGEQMLGGGDPAVPARQLRAAENKLRNLPEMTYPSLAEAVATFKSWSFERVFSEGLESLIGGAQRYRRSDSGVAISTARGSKVRGRTRARQRSRKRR